MSKRNHTRRAMKEIDPILAEVAQKHGGEAGAVSAIGSMVSEKMAKNPQWGDPLLMRSETKPILPWNEVMKSLNTGMTMNERAEWARDRLNVARATNSFNISKLEAEERNLEDVERTATELNVTCDWIVAGKPKLERVQDSIWHKLRAYALAHEQSPVQKRWFQEEPQIFLIQHNWAAAFAETKDFNEGPFVLPYDFCAFEFIINGRRLLHLVKQNEEAQSGVFCIQCGPDNWFIGAPADGEADEGMRKLSEWSAMHDKLLPGWTEITDMVDSNVRAICVALDADVAVSEVIRSPYRMNMIRERNGKLPIADHHVVNLAKRSRVEALPSSDHEAKWHPRLHFRRGHWRHFAEHKTWIKWMLVGNPDLGFIDKQYRA